MKGSSGRNGSFVLVAVVSLIVFQWAVAAGRLWGQEPVESESAPAGPALRTWTDTNGNKLEARYLHFSRGRVALKKPNGRIVRVPLGLLSEEDQQYVREQLQREAHRQEELNRLKRWEVQPERLPEPKLQPARTTILLPGWYDSPKELSAMLLDRRRSRLIVGYLGKPEQRGKHPTSAGFYWCDLPSGRVLGPIEAPEIIVPRSISNDGLHLLAVAATSDEIVGETVSLWEMSAQGITKQLEWKPYGAEGDLRNRVPRWATFADDDDYVLTLSSGGKLAVWQLSARKLVVGADLRSSWAPYLTPDHKYVMLRRDNQLHIFETKTGKLAGRLPVTCQYQPAVSFSGDGQRMYTMLSHHTLKIWDFATGKLLGEKEVPLRMGYFSIRVLDSNKLFLNQRELFDIEKGMTICRYDKQPVGKGIVCYAGWLIALVTDSQTSQAGIVMVQLPHPAIVRFLEDPASDPNVLLRPGVGIRVSVEIDATVASANELRQALEEQLKANGLVIDPQSPIELRAWIKKIRDVKLLLYYDSWNMAWGGQPDEVRNFPIYETKVTLLDHGRPVWNRGYTNSVPSGLTVTEREIRSAQKPGVWLFKSLGLPMYLSKTGEDMLRARITLQGIQ